ncbi:hypothetical protein PVAND_016105 [Polypedilum vanderplanki]|uniref:Uncharacterized protein n=1 Tax=Polypedilum vanderplanki TaxID=319348 RepID=A0A9J6BE48_POLVA|nr:hypothetical protein PVAND_016105 [Polypedilum vanderplanki]
MPPTNKIPPGWTFNPWSHTGHKNCQQPDNAEFDLFRRNESCLAVLHNVYDDGLFYRLRNRSNNSNATTSTPPNDSKWIATRPDGKKIYPINYVNQETKPKSNDSKPNQ